MAKIFLTRYLLLLFYVSAGLGSHFRGAIFMVRPSASGVKNEVNARSFLDCKIILFCELVLTGNRKLLSIIIVEK